MKGKLIIAFGLIMSLEAQALQTQQEFLNSVNSELTRERKSNGNYNFNNKTNFLVIHNDGTIEYPLLKSGKLLPKKPDKMRRSRLVGTSSHDSDRIAETLNFSLDDDATPINIDAEGQPSNDGYHPLQSRMTKKNGNEYFRVTDSDEILIYGGGKNNVILAENLSVLRPRVNIHKDALHAVTTTDINSDGIEEIINISHDMHSTTRHIMTTNPTPRFTLEDTFSNFLEPSRTWYWNNSHVKAIGGDFNGDKVKDELLVVYNGQVDLYRYNETRWQRGWKLVDSHNPWVSGNRSWNLSVDAKDIDGVPGLEVIAVYSPQESYLNTNYNVRGRYELYRYKNGGGKQFIIGSKNEEDPLFNSIVPDYQFIIPTDVKFAQLVPEGNYEVAVAGHVTYANNWEHAVIESASIDLIGRELFNHSRYEWTAINPVMDWRPELIAWHADDRGDLLVFNDQVVRRQLDKENKLASMVSVGSLAHSEPTGYRAKAAVVNFEQPNNSDSKDYPELVYMWVNNSTGELHGGGYIDQAFLNENGELLNVKLVINDITPEPYPYQQITAVNWVNDETFALYKGHHLRYTEPQIYAVLASAPFYEEQVAPSPLAGTSLSLAESSGSSDKKENSHGWGIEYGLNFEASGGFFGQAKVSLEASQYFESEQAQAWLNGVNNSVSVTFNGSLSDDTVVLSVVPTDHYSYSMVNSDFKPLVKELTTTDNGADFVIDVPRPAKLVAVTLNFMKEHGLENQYIDFSQLDSLLQHKTGAPSSYMTKEQMIRKIREMEESDDVITFKGRNLSNMAIANQGIGNATSEMMITYGKSDEQHTGFTQVVGGNGTLGFGTKADVPIFGEAEISSSITKGGWGAVSNTHSISADSSSTIIGSVPNISEDDFNLRGLRPFNWGIVGFPIDLNPTRGKYGAVRKPLLVTYWVDGASH